MPGFVLNVLRFLFGRRRPARVAAPVLMPWWNYN